MKTSRFNGEARPVIGISGDTVYQDGALRHWLRDSYVSAIVEAGGAPLIIPATGHEASTYALYQRLDGLLLTGGGDVNPALYHEADQGTETRGIQPHRDSTELMLAGWALADDLPVLGICRGHQVLNIAQGGTLYQDLPSLLPQSQVDHRGSTYTADRSLLTHRVRMEPGCKLAAVFGNLEFEVNSLHHQGVKALGEGLVAVGVAEDGLIEAMESRRHRWVTSVQWHPEELWSKQGEASRLFKTFVEAVRAASRTETEKLSV